MGREFEPLSGQIIEVAIHVHTALGPGFLESVYENAMKVALSKAGLRSESQKEIRIFYDEVEIGLHRLDLLVEGQIIVELKAVKSFEDIHFAQLKSYLKATGCQVGLLLNFNSPILAIKRVVLGAPD